MSKINITCNSVAIEAKSSVKYLGAIIDQNMSGYNMGNNIVKKVNNRLKFLYSKSKFITKLHHRKMLCSALLQSAYDYRYNVYYRDLTKHIKNKLQTSQNKIVRFILGYKSQHHIGVNDFKKFKFLNVENRINYLTLNMMFNVYYDRAPRYLSQKFSKCENVHTCTRYSENSFNVPSVKTQGSLTFVFNGTKLWNSLPVIIKSIVTKDRFKKKVRSLLLNKMYDQENNDFVY